MDIAIQIVNYNTKQYLDNCLGDIIQDLKNSNISYKILVLDNASSDDLEDLKKKYENVDFYFSGKNLGFGGGHNLLSAKTESEYILILNPDLKFIEKDTVARLHSFIIKQNNVAAIGPKLINQRGVQRYDHGELNGLLAKICTYFYGSYWKNNNEISESAWVSGAFLLVKRSVFDQMKGFDENFFLYGEENDLCLRIRNAGYKIIYDPEIKVFHYGSVVASKSKYLGASKRYFIKKWK